MAGNSNSGRPRLSDEEKKRRGTFRADKSDAVALERKASTVITGVFLAKVTEPELPLNPIGRAKYFEFAELLLQGNKLTSVTRANCESAGAIWQKMHRFLSDGKEIPGQVTNQWNAAVRDLRVAEDAPAIANPGQKNKFAGIGFANSRHPKVVLLSSGTAAIKGR